MKVLLTGNNGYIGSVMSTKLLEAGHEVIGLDTGYFAGCDFGELPKIPEIAKDIRDVGVSDLQGFDAVIHLAALSNDPMADIDRDLTYDINLFGTIRLAQVAKFAGAGRFLFASSCSVYGAGAMTEDGEVFPLSYYAIAKLRAEEGLLQLSDRHFSSVILRNGTAFGVSPKLRTDLVINAMVKDAFLHGVIKVFGSGRPWRPVVHVEDISQAFLLCLEADKDVVHNQVFNVGSDECNYYVHELAQFVQNVVPESKIEYVDNGKDARSYQVNFSKIYKTFKNWKPKWDAESGARQLYEAYKDFGVTSMSCGSFVRLTTLQRLKFLGILNEQLRWRENGKS